MPPGSHRIFGGLAADSFGDDDSRRPLVFLHGLGFDRHMWRPVIDELAVLDKRRRAVCLDLPGHGGSPRRDDYGLDAVAELVNIAVLEAGLDSPVMVGHSIGAALATRYAARYPAGCVVNVDQPLLVAGFADILRDAEPALRGPNYLHVWTRLQDGMRIDLLPPAAQHRVRSYPPPAQDLLLGYWNELLVTPAQQLTALMARTLETLRAGAVAYRYIAGTALAPAFLTWLETALPGVEITVFPGSGHFPQLAHPTRFAQLLSTCL